MIAVIFEVEVDPDRRQAYLARAEALRPLLERMDGFLSIERFASMKDDGRILSLSFWRDEESVERWRTQSEHQAAQRAGREEIFRDYRLRVGTILRDYGMNARGQAPADLTGA